MTPVRSVTKVNTRPQAVAKNMRGILLLASVERDLRDFVDSKLGVSIVLDGWIAVPLAGDDDAFPWHGDPAHPGNLSFGHVELGEGSQSQQVLYGDLASPRNVDASTPQLFQIVPQPI